MLHGWIGNEIPVRREQAKLVTDGSGNAKSGGYSRGTGSLRHDELMESELK